MDQSCSFFLMLTAVRRDITLLWAQWHFWSAADISEVRIEVGSFGSVKGNRDLSVAALNPRGMLLTGTASCNFLPFTVFFCLAYKRPSC